MKVTLSKYAGFCEGVQRAYDIVKTIAQDESVKRPIFVLGSLVHNQDVVEQIEKLGVRKLELEGGLEETLERNKNKIGTLVITAHGMGPEIYEIAKQKEIKLVDTTCPRVIKVQRLAKAFFERDAQIVIIGERNHKEVKGIFEWAQKKAVFVETPEDLCGFTVGNPNRKIALLSQTTQDQDFVEGAVARIKEKYPQAEAVDSICLTTHHRQNEVKEMAASHDVMVVIGSPESANSNRLFEISKKINEKSFFIEGVKQLRDEWLEGVNSVGVSAGASTPEWIIKKVVGRIAEIGKEIV